MTVFWKNFPQKLSIGALIEGQKNYKSHQCNTIKNVKKLEQIQAY